MNVQVADLSGRPTVAAGVRDVPILVVSCDAYSDLWPVFAFGLETFWPDCPFPVFLGTNRKEFDHPSIRSLKSGEDRSWTENVANYLDQLGTDHVILMLEDFFIFEPVDTGRIRGIVKAAQDSDVASIRFSPLPPPTPLPTDAVRNHPGLCRVARGAAYRVSTQPAVWRTSALRRLLVPKLSAWEFEHLGTALSNTLDLDFWGPTDANLRYDHVVEKGKWKPSWLDAIRSLGFEPDLSRRDVFAPEVLDALLSVPTAGAGAALARQRATEAGYRGDRRAVVGSLAPALREQPLDARNWGLLLVGLLGPTALGRLERWRVNRHLARKPA